MSVCMCVWLGDGGGGGGGGQMTDDLICSNNYWFGSRLFPL